MTVESDSPNDRRPPPQEPPATVDAVLESDEESFPASDAPGWILQTTIGSPATAAAGNALPTTPGPAQGDPPAGDCCRRGSGEEATTHDHDQCRDG